MAVTSQPARDDADGVVAFAAARARLLSIAYRMLGSMAEAEDVVADVAERWLRADRDDVESPEAWLVTVTTRRAMDVLRSARRQRVEYPGVWLPEPVATADVPGERLERSETLTMGMLVLLERLTPLERAVFVLHDGLGYPHADIAAMLRRSSAACRQALRRARRHVDRPTDEAVPVERSQAEAVVGRFLLAAAGGDVDALVETLASDVVVLSDGGGVVYAGMRPVCGVRAAARLTANLARRYAGGDVFPLELNGAVGVLGHADGQWAALVFDVDAATELISTVYVVVAPAKLRRLVEAVGGPAGLPGVDSGAGRFRHRRGRPVDPPPEG